jgi:large subunit ribosomal protein L23
VYTFIIAQNATKIDVKNAVRMLYGVSVKSVRVLHVEGKDVRFGARAGRRNAWKKAMVTLPAGSTIDVHEGV